MLDWLSYQLWGRLWVRVWPTEYVQACRESLDSPWGWVLGVQSGREWVLMSGYCLGLTLAPTQVQGWVPLQAAATC